METSSVQRIQCVQSQLMGGSEGRNISICSLCCSFLLGKLNNVCLLYLKSKIPACPVKSNIQLKTMWKLMSSTHLTLQQWLQLKANVNNGKK